MPAAKSLVVGRMGLLPGAMVGVGHLRWPGGVAIDAAGRLVVGDCKAHRVLIFRPGGGGVERVLGGGGAGEGGGGAALGELDSPTGVAVDARGRVLVAERRNHRVTVFAAPASTADALAGCGGCGSAGAAAGVAEGWLGLGEGSGPGQLRHPRGVAVCPAGGRVYVADYGNHRVQATPPRPPPTTAAPPQSLQLGDSPAKLLIGQCV